MLKAITKLKGDDQQQLGSPSIFYALLLADGDSLGKLLQSYGTKPVSEALLRFTNQVPRIVKDHSGVVVYAGGDDVLAMVPVPTALACAQTLADAYRASFDWEHSALPGNSATEAAVTSEGPVVSDETQIKAEPTLSAAVLFTHARIPMGNALDEVRRLLDDVAKDGNGRDSLAVGVLNRGGINAQWVTSWQRPSFKNDSLIEALDALQAIVAHLDRDDGGRLSSSLLYRIRNTMGLLCNWPSWSPGSWGELIESIDLPSFLRSDVKSSLSIVGLP